MKTRLSAQAAEPARRQTQANSADDMVRMNAPVYEGPPLGSLKIVNND